MRKSRRTGEGQTPGGAERQGARGRDDDEKGQPAKPREMTKLVEERKRARLSTWMSMYHLPLTMRLMNEIYDCKHRIFKLDQYLAYRTYHLKMMCYKRANIAETLVLLRERLLGQMTHQANCELKHKNREAEIKRKKEQYRVLQLSLLHQQKISRSYCTQRPRNTNKKRAAHRRPKRSSRAQGS